jgi:PD-(D/E)XK nuclease superfamily
MMSWPASPSSICWVDGAQRMHSSNYLKATGLQLCLLLNFGKPRPEIKRAVHSL